MTGVRQSVIVGEESDYGSGELKTGGKWFGLPPNFFLQATPTISTTELYSTGSKFFDTVDYGQFSGSWEISFAMDYEHLGLYSMVFDTHTSESTTNGRWKHTFTVTNGGKVPSFVMKGRILNHMTANGGSDEQFTLKGCVAKSIRFSRSSGAARTTVTISGFYQDEEVTLGAFNPYFEEYDGRLVEFSCLFKGDVKEDNYMANVESITVGLDIGTSANYTVCRSTPVGYYSGKADIQLGMTAYANDFKRYRALVMGGGTETTNVDGTTYKFMCKKKTPMPKMTVSSFTECRTDDLNFEDAQTKSDRSVAFILEDVIMNSFTRQKGDGSRLIDQMSSSKCRKLTLEIVNDKEDLGYRTDVS